MKAGELYCLAIGWGIVRGLNPLWFCQGTGQKLERLAAYDVLASILALICIYCLIRQESSGALYFFLLILWKGSAFAAIWTAIIRNYFSGISFRAGLILLRNTTFLSGVAFSQLISYNGSQLILGYFISAESMGLIGAITKIIRALASLINPVSQALYPQLCRGMARSERLQLLRRSLLVCVGAACICAALAAWLAAWLLELALGPPGIGGVEVLRIMLLAAPLMVLDNVLSIQILAPLGLEGAQLRVQIVGIAVCFALTALLGKYYGIYGGAWIPVILESFLAAGFLWQIRRYCPQALWH